LSKEKGNVVVNLSTTRGVDDIASTYGCKVFRSPVGEANVVKLMKEVSAIIGGEGSGGVIYPELHYGRDALVGIAITLQQLLEFSGTMDALKKTLPQYSVVKMKIGLTNKNPDEIIDMLYNRFRGEQINMDDGLRIDFPDHSAHFRKSNTEPLIRLIVEAKSGDISVNYIKNYMGILSTIVEG
jgi:phosphomannomutase